MRFHWFHLMPYPFLPDDFTQKYRSVWVDVPSTLYDPEKGHWLYKGHLMLLLQMGDRPDALARENTQRFAHDVMPYLKGLWSEYEEHWYPAPWITKEVTA